MHVRGLLLWAYFCLEEFYLGIPTVPHDMFHGHLANLQYLGIDRHRASIWSVPAGERSLARARAHLDGGGTVHAREREGLGVRGS